MTQSFRSEFDLDPELIYLNSGTHSICPRVVLQAVTRYQGEFEKNPTASVFAAWGKLWDVQKRLARFFGADAHDLFLRPNVTAALNDFILGYEMPKGGEILITDLEYGAIINLCRFRAERDQMRLRTMHLPILSSETATMTEDQWVELIVRELKPDTRMLMVSHIMTANGLVLPLRKLARETRKRGVVLAVDGAHGPGAVPLDFAELDDVDFYGGNLHKWMMGPKGTSFGWVPKRGHERLRPVQAGWTTYEVSLPFSEFGEGDSFQGRMLSSACKDFAPFFALRDLLDFWHRLGTERIYGRIRELGGFLEAEIQKKLGWECFSPPAGPMRGPLLAFELGDRLSEQGFGLLPGVLKEHRLQIMTPMIQGRFRLRLSPHIYNTEAEISRAVEILSRL